MVFQNYALFPHMTAQNNVLFPLRMRRFPKREIKDRAERMLALVGLQRLRRRAIRASSPAGSSSASRWPAASSSIPTCSCSTSRSARSTRTCASRCRSRSSASIASFGITMIYVTHDQTEAMTMSDRVAVFSNGRLAQVGSPLDVYQPPGRAASSPSSSATAISLPGRIDPARPGVVELAGIGAVRVASQRICRRATWILMIRPERLRPCAAQRADGRTNSR